MLRRRNGGKAALGIATLLAVLLAVSALAEDGAGHARLMGSWKPADAAKEGPIWTFREKGEILHVSNTNGGKVLAEFDCDSLGHVCSIKDGGRPATVSLWYEGAKLIEMEKRGDSSWKRTFTVTGEGDTMDVEVSQYAPWPKEETQHFARVTVAEASR